MVIEKLITELRKRIDQATPDQLPIYQEILDLAYSLMDEPVAEDLEQASNDYVKSTLVGSPSIKKNAFKAGATWDKKKWIAKVEKYLDKVDIDKDDYWDELNDCYDGLCEMVKVNKDVE
jgi:hypothetical protein